MNIKQSSVFMISFLVIQSLLAISQDDRRVQLNQGERRTALVIGNGDYSLGKLRNSTNDSRAIKKVLESYGFKVIYKENIDLREMKSSVQQLADELRDNKGVGLFYFAGHGVQIGGRNYLLPVGVNIKNEGDIEFECFPADRILSTMEYTGNRLNIVILDACRNNPFTRGFSRGVSNGLATMESGKGAFIAYATAPGMTASDGPEMNNGLFTYHFIEVLKEPGLSMGRVFDLTRERVFKASKGEQHPWATTSVIGDFIFNNKSSQDSQAMETYKPSLPPATGDIDLSKFKAESERIQKEKEKEKAAWDGWQGKFKGAVEEAKKLDGDKNLSAKSKKSAWEDVLKGFENNNPYSDSDEELLKYVRSRIKFWEESKSIILPVSTARELFNKIINAYGGIELLYKNRTEEYSLTITMPQGEFSMEGKNYTIYPDKYRMDMNSIMGSMTRVYSGDTGWADMGGKVMELSEAEVSDAKKERSRELTWLAENINKLTIDTAGDEDVDQRKTTRLIIKNGDEHIATFSVDKESFLILKRNYMGKDAMTGAPIEQEVYSSDFKTIAGTQVPFKTIIKQGGKQIMEIKMKKVEIGIPINQYLFNKKN